MASSKHLRLAAAIVLTVLLGHWAALSLLQSLWRDAPLLRPLATPMYTRLLVPTQPPPPPAVHEAAAPVRVKRPLSAATPRVADKKKAGTDPSTQTAAAPAPPASAASAASAAASASNAEPATAPTPEPSVAAASATTPASSAGPASSPADATPTVAASATAPSTTSTMASATASSATPTATASATGTASVTAAAAATPASAPPASKDLWPADTRLNYRLSGYYRGELTGDARVQWQRTGEQYQVRIEVEVGLNFRILTLTSQGTVTPQGLVPRAYEEQLRSRRRNVTLGEQQITLEQSKQVPRPAGVQDTASQFVELAYLFSSGRAVLQPGRNIQFWMARPSAVDLWTYDMIEEVTVHTPRLGPVRAIHLKPRPIANPRGNITAQMWFAPSLQYLPVRIRIDVGEGSYVDLMVDQIEQR